MRGVLVLACLLLAARVEANPVVGMDLRSAITQFDVHTDLGLVAKVDLPKFGLLKGDVIRTINGHVPSVTSDFSKPATEQVSVIHLEVIRAGKPVSLKLVLRPEAMDTQIERDRFKEMIAGLHDLSTVRPTTSGLVILSRFALRYDGITIGDIVRKVGGKPVSTIDQLVTALEGGLAKPKLVVDVERAGQPFTVTFVIETTGASDPEVVELVDKIEKVSDTSYKIPRKLAELVVKNPMMFAKGARVVPAMKDGKPEGIKLYAIRPSSLHAKLGLNNGDTVFTVNGTPLDSAAKAHEVFKKIGSASKLMVELRRRGKVLTLEWTLK